jgi:spore coat protein CotH
MRSRLAFFFLTCGLGAVAQMPPPHPAFNQDAVHEIRLRFPNADWYEVLTANYSGVKADNPYFPASFEWGSYKYDTVGVRFKGNSSYNITGKKKPFRIKLNEFVKGQKIEGMASFSLSNAWGDPSFVREKAYYELAAALGLKAPRSNFAALYINDEYWGLYVLTEVVNGDFLKAYFGKGEDGGNLYKANLGASFAYLGTDKAAYAEVWEKQSNEEADDWTDLMALCKLINDTPAEELAAKLAPVVDIDSVLTALALDNATVNLDSYVGMGQNFNIYRRPSDNRWVWIVWDPSLAFGGLSQGLSTQQMEQLALEWTAGAGGGGALPGGAMPGGGGAPGGTPPGGTPPGGPAPGGGVSPGGANSSGRPLATKLWAAPEFKERYRQIYTQLMERVFLAGPTVARMEAWRDLIRPWVEKDTQKLATMEQFEAAMSTDAGGSGPGAGQMDARGGGMVGAPGLKPFIEARVAAVRSLLADSPPPVMALTADKTSLAFSIAAGGSAPAQTVSLTVNGTSTPSYWSARVSTQSGGTWLTATPTGGAVAGSFAVSVAGSKLEAGVYTGQLEIWSAGASNSPLVLPVSLTVTR